MRACTAVFLAFPAMCVIGCDALNLSGLPRSDQLSSRAIFIDPTSGFRTTELRDFDEEAYWIDDQQDQIVRASDGLRFDGWEAEGTIVATAEATYEVRFGLRDGERRAYLTQVEPPNIVDLSVENETLIVIPTVFFPPQGATSARATGNGIYKINGIDAVNGLFVFDTETDFFMCTAVAGGSTVGAEGNFTMVIIAHPPIDRVLYDTVQINGTERNRVRFTVEGFTVTVNNGFAGLPGLQAEGDILFDELTDCKLVVEAIDDDERGDLWRTTIYDAPIWEDGTQFKNFEGQDISTGKITGPIAGNITVTPASE